MPLDRLLSGAGYTRVPLRTSPPVPLLRVTARRGRHDLALVLDTGASNCVLDARLAGKLGLKPEKLPDDVPVLGGKVAGSMAWMSGIHVGDVELPPFPWVLIDLNDGRSAAEAQQPGTGFDGLIGMNLLQHLRGVVDVTTPAVHLLDPVRQEAGLQGGWQGVAVVNASGRHVGGLARSWLLQVTGIDARLHPPGPAAGDYKLSLNLSASPKELNLQKPDGPAGYQAVYRLNGDELTVAMPVCDGDDFGKRPASVEPPAKGGYTVITFKRVKPAAPAKKSP